MCDFCTTDREGYSRLLHRYGTGNAYIRVSHPVGAVIAVNGPHKTHLEIPIQYCPLCGRKLKEEI